MSYSWWCVLQLQIFEITYYDMERIKTEKDARGEDKPWRGVKPRGEWNPSLLWCRFSERTTVLWPATLICLWRDWSPGSKLTSIVVSIGESLKWFEAEVATALPLFLHLLPGNTPALVLHSGGTEQEGLGVIPQGSALPGQPSALHSLGCSESSTPYGSLSVSVGVLAGLRTFLWSCIWGWLPGD